LIRVPEETNQVNTRIFYEITSERLEEILDALDQELGLKPTYVENYITMRGQEESGIETVRLSLEGAIIKVLVVLESPVLLEKFNSIFGEPTKVKGKLN
jgi:translation initiation factor 2 alpha subunit (eIF-2alpha)